MIVGKAINMIVSVVSVESRYGRMCSLAMKRFIIPIMALSQYQRIPLQQSYLILFLTYLGSFGG